jgi:hypothetical protein
MSAEDNHGRRFFIIPGYASAEACPDCLHTKCGEDCVCDCRAAYAEDLAADLAHQRDSLRAQLAASEARCRVMRETAELLSRVGNRIVLTAPERDNPHHRELERAVGLSIAPLAQPADDGALRELLMRVARVHGCEDEDACRESVDAVLRGER